MPGASVPALRVASVYALFSVLWILFSDQVLLLFISDAEVMTRVQMVKGWLFVITTSVIIYFLLVREINRVVSAERALTQKEQDYLQIFNATEEGIIIHDADSGLIIDVNNSFLRMFGYSRLDIPGISVEDFSSGDAQYSQVEAERMIQLAKEAGPQLFEWRCRRKSGELFWAEVALRKAIISNRSRIIAVVRDIDDRKQAEEVAAEYERRLLQSQKMEAIGTLAGGIAHDFNNILTAVLGYSELMKDEVDPKTTAAEYLQHVIDAANRARDLVKQILTFSRSNQQTNVPVKVQEIIREAVKLLRASIPATIEIKTIVDDTCPPVSADPTQLHQVVMNLCTNSYHAMRESGGTLEIKLLSVVLDNQVELAVSGKLKAGRYLLLSVRDEGVGMSKEIIQKIFDPYFTTRRPGQGTGMGLSVSLGIVRNLGGGISVTSSEGRGSTFSVYLAVGSRHDVITAAPETAAHEKTGSGHILLVDDEKLLTDLVSRILKSFGYTVTAFTDPRDAIAQFSEDPDRYDLIITDMNMPHIDGLGFIRRCREVNSVIPIMLCTGYSDRVDRKKALAEGANDFLYKPIQRKELGESVASLLREIPPLQ